MGQDSSKPAAPKNNEVSIPQAQPSNQNGQQNQSNNIQQALQNNLQQSLQQPNQIQQPNGPQANKGQPNPLLQKMGLSLADIIKNSKDQRQQPQPSNIYNQPNQQPPTLYGNQDSIGRMGIGEDEFLNSQNNANQGPPPHHNNMRRFNDPSKNEQQSPQRPAQQNYSPQKQPTISNQKQRRKMRDVSDAKKLAYFQAQSRVINLQTVKKNDLMLCVKENQLAFAKHIIKAFPMVDICELKGIDDYINIDILGKQTPYSTKGWNPFTWAFYTKRREYFSLFFEAQEQPTLKPHLTLCLDVSNSQSIYQSDVLDERYLNKGKLMGLQISIMLRDWETFEYIVDKSYRYMTGWHIFACFRQFIECNWIESTDQCIGGLLKYLDEASTFIILRAMPKKNRDSLIDNMKQYMKFKILSQDLSAAETLLNNIQIQIDSNYDSFLSNEKLPILKEITTKAFDIISQDQVPQLEMLLAENAKLFAQIDLCTLLLGKCYNGTNLQLFTSLEKISFKSLFTKQIEPISFDKVNPVTFAIICNAPKCLDLLLNQPSKCHAYTTVKPGALDYSDTCSLRHTLFPLVYALSKGYLDVFKYFYGNQYSLWRPEHLKQIMEEALSSGRPDLIEYVVKHARTATLFNCLTYEDRMVIAGQMSGLGEEYIRAQVQLMIEGQRPYMGPYVFYTVGKVADQLNIKVNIMRLIDLLAEEDLGEYIEGVGSNQAFAFVSKLSDIFTNRPMQANMPTIAILEDEEQQREMEIAKQNEELLYRGLERLVDLLESHYAYL
ncbi:hypothetical protein FGO68_gene2241 [Halteria grandinella]|uniref:Uncharacterized protein n=1 Tax=Halteria grandinella TaxID=5974 RepID=A0A8J8T594_HALGN|nr:hypothetical protein FGO68_gene2241 [Halteria grandinella]